MPFRVTNIHIERTRNIGDLSSAPCLYFDLDAEKKDITSGSIDTDKPLIIGGGGLGYPAFSNWFSSMVSNHKAPVVVWGVGGNVHGSKNVETPEWVGKAALAGIRDFGSGYEWVPCASCMHPAFSRHYPVRNVLVAYVHGGIGLSARLPKGTPIKTNFGCSLEEAVKFISQGEYVVTNSYHGVYWATLLGRKVIVDPFSSRHRFFKHPPASLEGKSVQTAMDEAKPYPEALEECREANRSFFEKVSNML
jgi:hypothetical protein